MSAIEIVIRESKRLETMLEQHLGATGRGLHEKVSSVDGSLPRDLVKRIRYIATVRNSVVHEDGFELAPDKMADFQATCMLAGQELMAAARQSQAAPSFEQSRSASYTDSSSGSTFSTYNRQRFSPHTDFGVFRRFGRKATWIFVAVWAAGFGTITFQVFRPWSPATEHSSTPWYATSTGTSAATQEDGKNVDELFERMDRADTPTAKANAAQRKVAMGTGAAAGRANEKSPGNDRGGLLAASTSVGNTIMGPVALPMKVLSIKMQPDSFGAIQPDIQIVVTNHTGHTISRIDFGGALFIDGAQTSVTDPKRTSWFAVFGQHGLRDGESQRIALSLNFFNESEWKTPDIVNASSRVVRLTALTALDGSNHIVDLHAEHGAESGRDGEL